MLLQNVVQMAVFRHFALYTGHFQLVGDPGVDAENDRDYTYLIWSGTALGSSGRAGEKGFGATLLSLLPL